MASQEFRKDDKMDPYIKEIVDHKEIDIKVVIKWILAPLIAKELNCKSNVTDDFVININFWNFSDTMEVFMPFKDFMRDYDKRPSKKLKVDKQKPETVAITNHNIDTILKLPTNIVLNKLGDESLTINYSTSTDIEVCSSNVYFCGNYLKFKRNLSQTPWQIDGKRLYDTSLSEEIDRIVSPYFNAISHKFHSGGREDIDVRMLGEGRPFILELESPKKRFSITDEMLKDIVDKVNLSEYISIRNVRIEDENCFRDLQKSTEDKIKGYCCVVITTKEITDEKIKELENLSDIQLKQKTPLRV